MKSECKCYGCEAFRRIARETKPEPLPFVPNRLKGVRVNQEGEAV